MKMVLLDCSSVSQLIYMQSCIDNAYEDRNRFIVLWSGKCEIPDEIVSYFMLNNIVRINNINTRNIFSYVYGLFSLKRLLSRVLKCKNPDGYSLWTSFNDGLKYQCIKSAAFIDNNNVYLFPDGSSSFACLESNRYTVKKISYMMMGLDYDISKHILSCSESLVNIKAISPDYYHLQSIGKKVDDIGPRVKEIYKRLYEKEFKGEILEKSALILTSHSVESKRIGESEYYSVIQDVITTVRGYGVHNIYYSMHHAEDHIYKRQRYESLGLKELSSAFPSEVFLFSTNIKILVQPYNSVVPIMYGINKLEHQELVISYRLPGITHFEFTQQLIKRIMYSLPHIKYVEHSHY